MLNRWNFLKTGFYEGIMVPSTRGLPSACVSVRQTTSGECRLIRLRISTVRRDLGVAHSTFQLATLRDIAVLSSSPCRGTASQPLPPSLCGSQLQLSSLAVEVTLQCQSEPQREGSKVCTFSKVCTESSVVGSLYNGHSQRDDHLVVPVDNDLFHDHLQELLPLLGVHLVQALAELSGPG